MEIEQMYRQIILEHNSSTRNRHHLEHPTIVKEGVNPSCGDEITLELEINEGVIKNISFTGSGCAISQASVSIMADLLKGKTIEEAADLQKRFMGMIHNGTVDDAALMQLQEATVFSSISHMPARVKCAVLGWRTLEQALFSELKGKTSDGDDAHE